MNKSDYLRRAARNGEERALLSRAWDLMEACARRGVAQYTHFLTPEEQRLVENLLRAAGNPAHAFWGGYAEAQRRLCVFLPDWLELDGWEDQPISALRAVWHAPDSLNHRDLLGALMGQGIKREMVGDLLVDRESCDILTLAEMAPYLRQNLTGAGRARLTVTDIALGQLHIPVQEVKRIHDTVATLRLDAVAAAGFSLSRAKMAELIRAGRVSVNWAQTERTDLPVKAGDVISCRGLGRCRLAQTGALSRKGRINIDMERYL